MTPQSLCVIAVCILLIFRSGIAAEISDTPRLQASVLDLQLTPDIENQIRPLNFKGAVSVARAGADFYGWSGLWVSDDGARFAAVDGGEWAQGTLSYDSEGNLVSLTVQEEGPLLDESGHPFTNDDDKDAEALDFDGSRFLVGFETHDRVLAYRDFKSPSELIPLPQEALAGISRGTGFSSVAHLPGGAMIALPEYVRENLKQVVPSFVAAQNIRGWLMSPDGEGPLWLTVEWGWLPVSLSPFPNGDLLLLEVFGNVRGKITDTRLSRIDAKNLSIGTIFPSEKIAVITPPLVDGRFEGSSIRRGSQGETLIYLMVNDKPSALYMFELSLGE